MKSSEDFSNYLNHDLGCKLLDSGLIAIVGLRHKTGRKDRAVCSLSFLRENRNFRQVQDFEDLGINLKVEFSLGTNALESVLEQIIEADHLGVDVSIEHRAILVYNSKDYAISHTIAQEQQRLYERYLHFRNHSLNLVNLSKERRLEDWNCLRTILKEKKSVKEAVTTFAEFVGERYGSYAAVFELSALDGVLSWTLVSGDLPESFELSSIKECMRSTREMNGRESRLKNAMLSKAGSRTLVWIPFYGKYTKGILRYGVVFTIEGELQKFFISNCEYFVSHFFSSVLSTRRFQTLSGCLRIIRQVPEHYVGKQVSNYSDLYSRIEGSVNEVLKLVLPVADAISLTVRRFCHQGNSLKLLSYEVADGAETGEPLQEYRVSSDTASLDVVVYGSSDKDGVYIDDLLGSGGGVISRPLSRSEFCVPIFLNQSKWGTFKVESSVPNGFDHELIEFFRAAAGVIGLVLERHIRECDIGSYVDGMIKEERMHELRGKLFATIALMPSMRVAQLRARVKRMAEFFKVFQLSDDDEYRSLSALKIGARDIINGFLDIEEETRVRLVDSIRFKGLPEWVLVDPRRYELILIVIKNLILNLYTHGNLGEDDILATYKKNANMIVVTARSSKPTPDDFLEKAGLVRFRESVAEMNRDSITDVRSGRLLNLSYVEDDADDQIVEHSGLLIVGSICRSMGGSFDVWKRENQTLLVAKVPQVAVNPAKRLFRV